MIKYPNSNSKRKVTKKDNTLKDAVDTGVVRLGQRFFIGDNPVTCVHIDGNKYIFSMDDIFKTTSHDKIGDVLETIYTTGAIDGLKVIPIAMMQDIDFLFVPSERQVFGENKYGVEENDEQFEWFKRGDATRVKGYKGVTSAAWPDGKTCIWWLATVASGNSTYCCRVSYYGNVANSFVSSTAIGVPVFFQMTKKN